MAYQATTEVPVGDERRPAFELEFEIEREDWNVYKLLDGGRVRVKVVVAKMFQVLTDDGEFARTPDGDRLVVVRNNVQITVSE